MRRAVALVVAALCVGGIGIWGCAATKGNDRRDQKIAEIGGRPAEAPTPDGGWSNYKPAYHPYEPDPARAAAGGPSTSPVLAPLDSSH